MPANDPAVCLEPAHLPAQYIQSRRACPLLTRCTSFAIALPRHPARLCLQQPADVDSVFCLMTSAPATTTAPLCAPPENDAAY
ncbi:hypothetical protein HBI52_122460 [Parastagonospora nodorum]|nr:hypothetical protein HBI52_122460 [Parastagonospora nodorum]